MTNAYMPLAQRDDWGTPPDLFDALDREFGPFNVDPCGSREHHYTAFKIHSRGGIFYDGTVPALDGLTQPWRCGDQPGVVFMNPPYGMGEGPCKRNCAKKACAQRGHHLAEHRAGVDDFVPRAVEMVESGVARLALGLLKATPDTKWWHEYVLSESKIFAPGRERCNWRTDMYGHHRDCQHGRLGEIDGRATLVRFVPGRLRFVGANGPAPFPSAVVVWSR
jgi:hypothetical protein